VATLYRVHNQPEYNRASEMIVWGPKGWPHEPEFAQVELRYGVWVTIEGPYVGTRDDVNQYLRSCRELSPEWRIEVIRHAWGSAQ